MTQKKPEQTDTHDACVREIAEEMKKDKWHVTADLPGFDKPSKIGSYVPDILAKKNGCMNRICEVVTEEMFEGDRQRYIEVKNYCDEYDFRMFMIDKDGKRRQIDPKTYGKK